MNSFEHDEIIRDEVRKEISSTIQILTDPKIAEVTGLYVSVINTINTLKLEKSVKMSKTATLITYLEWNQNREKGDYMIILSYAMIITALTTIKRLQL